METTASDVEQLWRSLNVLVWKTFAVGSGDGHNWDEIHQEAAKAGDKSLASAVQSFRKLSESIDFNIRFLWLTSVSEGRKYPPIDAQHAGPLSWNAPDRLSEVSYPFKKLEERPCYSGIQQNSSINDCSLVASLINIRRNAPSSLRSFHIEYSSTYNINLHFNGAHNRLVRADTESIPTDARGELLALYSNNFEDIMLELAYLQVRNASRYDFRGSNTAVDTYLLNGFIPEICRVESSLYTRLKKLLKEAVCLVSLGTGSSVKDARFLINHDYPVLGLTSAADLIIRDPLNSSVTYTLSEDTFLKS